MGRRCNRACTSGPSSPRRTGRASPAQPVLTRRRRGPDGRHPGTSGRAFGKPALGLLALAAFLSVSGLCLSGCGGGAGSLVVADTSAAQEDFGELSRAVEGPAWPRPVADRTRAEVGLPRRFGGLAMSYVRPYDRSLESSYVFDLNFAYDIPTALSFEFSVGIPGLWGLPDRPLALAQADSTLEMVPFLATVLLAKELPFWRMRMYVGAGAGFSLNSYDLGAGHRDEMIQRYNLASYDVEVDDSLLGEACAGVELYSSWDAKLNLALEVRHMWTDIDLTEYPGAETRQDTADVKLWLFRGNVTWHW